MTLVSLSVPLCLSFSPLRHISFHHFSTFFLLSTLCFLALCFFIPCCSPSLSSLVFLSVLLVRLYLQHVRGGHFKSPMKCTLCVTFMTHTLLYLFFHFLPFFSSVVNTYIVVSLCGAPPSPPCSATTAPFPSAHIILSPFRHQSLIFLQALQPFIH